MARGTRRWGSHHLLLDERGAAGGEGAITCLPTSKVLPQHLRLAGYPDDSILALSNSIFPHDYALSGGRWPPRSIRSPPSLTPRGKRCVCNLHVNWSWPDSAWRRIWTTGSEKVKRMCLGGPQCEGRDVKDVGGGKRGCERIRGRVKKGKGVCQGRLKGYLRGEGRGKQYLNTKCQESRCRRLVEAGGGAPQAAGYLKLLPPR